MEVLGLFRLGLDLFAFHAFFVHFAFLALEWSVEVGTGTVTGAGIAAEVGPSASSPAAVESSASSAA